MKKNRIIIADERADDETLSSLVKLGYEVMPSLKLDILYDAIASHADIQIHYLGNDRFICAPECYEHYIKYFPERFTLIKGSVPLGSRYPADIPYNCAGLKNHLICSMKNTAPEIISAYTSAGKTIVDTAQGYSKCSTCIVSAEGIITSDSSVCSAAKKNGIDVLKIKEGHIKLRGFPYGFIGGASGLIEENLLAFNGELKTHPSCKEITDFCKRHKTEITELKKGMLEDIGSLIANTEYILP